MSSFFGGGWSKAKRLGGAAGKVLVLTWAFVQNKSLPRLEAELRRCLSFPAYAVLCVVLSGFPNAVGQATQPATQNPPGSEPVITFHASTRMVTLEVVARDHEGRPATGLTEKDFQIFEETGGFRKHKEEQKIAVFRPLGITELFPPNGAKDLQIPPGVYTNVLAPQKQPVPPTILLVDGLNTALMAQMQVHVQMMKMLRSLPNDVPVAVFLLGHGLHMLQNFTTDSSLLQAALEKAARPRESGIPQIDPRDDPDSLSNFMAGTPNTPASMLDSVQRFEQETYASTTDLRVRETIEALVSIARHVSGYPGRKNLLWISSSFPILLNPNMDDFSGFRTYQSDIEQLASALGEARVAVYPIDPAGLETSAFFQADSRNPSTAASALGRESQMRTSRRETMEDLANQTGGRVCVEDNDLGDCVRKAVNDSSAFYEMAYYPTSQKWNGEFRKVIIKTTYPGLHLAYRQGYFAKSVENENPKATQKELQQAACEDYLNATSVMFAVRRVRGDSPEQLKYFVGIDPNTLTFVPTDGGGRELNFAMVVCTFNAAGKPLQLMTDPINRTLSEAEYQTIVSMHRLPHFVVVPGARPASIRLLVKDIPSGRFGSVNIPVDQVTAAATTGTTAVSGAAR